MKIALSNSEGQYNSWREDYDIEVERLVELLTIPNHLCIEVEALHMTYGAINAFDEKLGLEHDLLFIATDEGNWAVAAGEAAAKLGLSPGWIFGDVSLCDTGGCSFCGKRATCGTCRHD